jgi:hypothetical protein
MDLRLWGLNRTLWTQAPNDAIDPTRTFNDVLSCERCQGLNATDLAPTRSAPRAICEHARISDGARSSSLDHFGCCR